MKLFKKLLPMCMCFVIACSIAIPASAAISVPDDSAFLGYYNSDTYPYIMVNVTKKEFNVHGVWSDGTYTYVSGVSTSASISKSTFTAELTKYHNINPSTNETLTNSMITNQTAYIQRSVSITYGGFLNSKVKKVTIKNDSDCPTNNKLYHEP